jgi:hypothetical protein
MRAILTVTVLAAASLASGADETAARVRAAATRGQESVFILKSLVSIAIQGQEQEVKIETPAVVLDGSGLMVAPNPEELFGNLPQGASLAAKSFRLIQAEGKEVEAKVVGRDTDFGLLFLRLDGKEGPAPAPLAAVHKGALQLGDQIFLLRRLSSAHPEPICQDSRVTSVVQKPRLMYMVSDSPGPCSVALTPEGELVGLTVVVKEQDAESGRTNQMMVVLPIAQVQEAAKGIREEAPAPETPGEEAPEPETPGEE